MYRLGYNKNSEMRWLVEVLLSKTASKTGGGANGNKVDIIKFYNNNQ